MCCLSWISVRSLFSFFRCVRSLLKDLYVAILTNCILFCLRFSSFCLCQLRQPAAGEAHNDDTKNWQLSSSPRGRKKPGFGFHLQSQERRVHGEKLCPCYFPKNAMMQAKYWIFFFFFLFPIYLCLRKSLQCSLNPPQRMFSILDLDVSVNIHCCVVHYFPLYPNLFNYVLGIQSNRCTHVLTFGNLNKMTQQAFSLKCIMYRYWSV